MIKVNISQVKANPKNPRVIKDAKFQKLVTSIKEFPDMLNKRLLIVFTDIDGKYCVLGGNMRLKALNELKYTEIPIIIADEWDAEKLDDWGLNVPKIEGYEDIEPSGYDSTQKWFLNIEFENEQDCEKWYNSLIEEGLICKIVQ
jgi:hypothetical protein